jgi:hypothetical protein
MMAQQGQGFDMSKMGSADKIVGGASVVFIIWTFLPFWYSYSGPGADFAEAVGGSTSISGFRGVTLLAWLLAVVAIIEVGIHAMSSGMSLPIKRGLLHLALGGVGALLTLLGLITAPSLFGASWGAFVGVVIALVWAYGAYMMYQEPGGMPAAGGGGESGLTS